MAPSWSLLPLAALVSLVQGHAEILAAVGDSGTSVGFQVDPALARNCTTISPCQQDATLIRDAEITSNVVNECGRTEIGGNIDVGENTENALAAGQITKVKAGSKITVTIHQVNADGAGPFVCDMDPTGNSLGVTGQTPLEVTNNIPGVNGFSQAKAQDFNITVAMPANMNCTGASTGNVCTVRCRNNALAGPFGGCFAVQQTDTTVKTNVASQITTAQTLSGITAQIQQNKIDLNDAIVANQNEGLIAAQQPALDKLLGVSVVTKAAAVQTPAAGNANAAAAAGTTTAAAAAAGTTTKAATGNGKGNGNGNGNGNANAKGNGNKATGNKNNNKRAEAGPRRFGRARRYVLVPSAEEGSSSE